MNKKATIVIDYENNQGWINARAEKLFDDKKALAEFMANKTDEQKRQTRSHLKTWQALRDKNGR